MTNFSRILPLLTLVIAVAALVLALWPVVGDAPWEYGVTEGELSEILLEENRRETVPDECDRIRRDAAAATAHYPIAERLMIEYEDCLARRGSGRRDVSKPIDFPVDWMPEIFYFRDSPSDKPSRDKRDVSKPRDIPSVDWSGFHFRDPPSDKPSRGK